jgi:hypothetical protein
MKKASFTLLYAVFIQVVFGQGIAKNDSTLLGNGNDGSKFNLRLNYTSDWIYAGRKDSLATPYLTPSILYAHKSGLFVKGFLSYLTTDKRVDVWGLGAGYRGSSKNVYWGISGEARFFNDSSYAVQSAVSSLLNAYIGYDLPWIESTVDVSGFFGDASDVLVGLELGKTFYLDNYRFSIYPNAYGLWGTQQYYNEYYTYKSTSQRKKQGQGETTPPPVLSGTTMEEATKFKFLSLELGIAFRYQINKIRLHFIPSYAIPYNAASFVTDNAISKENLKNTFYYNVGINILL